MTDYIYQDEIEVWRDVEGYEGLYQVSDHGRVKSLKSGKERILKPSDNGHGYLRVTLCKDSKVKTVTLHRIVAMHFIENPERKPEVNHLNIKTDNRVCSLEWATSSENAQHAWANGLKEKTRTAVRETGRKTGRNTAGENHGAHKLMDYEVYEIRSRYQAGGITQRALGDEYGVSDAQICYIVNNKSRARATPPRIN